MSYAILGIVIAIFVVGISWMNHQAGVANGLCQASGFERVQEWTWALDRPVRCESTVYGYSDRWMARP